MNLLENLDKPQTTQTQKNPHKPLAKALTARGTNLNPKN